MFVSVTFLLGRRHIHVVHYAYRQHKPTLAKTNEELSNYFLLLFGSNKRLRIISASKYLQLIKFITKIFGYFLNQTDANIINILE